MTSGTTDGLPSEDLAAIESFLVDNPDLRDLERQIAPFNFFEALGVVRQELRHSDFLSFLIDPRQNHALGDVVLKRLLQRAVRGRHGLSLSAIDIDIVSLTMAEVRREWLSIDISIADHENQIAIVIENKIDSDEHSDQCARYWNLMREQYPMLGIFLTPDGVDSTDSRYISLSYTDVADMIEDLVASDSSTIGAEVRILLSHYVQMLRRHIVEDSQIAELCRRIYQRHKRALDLIYEYRPDRQAQIREALEGFIREGHPDLILDHCTKTYVRFAVHEWDETVLFERSPWTPSGRMLLFEFKNDPAGVKLFLQLGPARDDEANDVRTRLFGAIANKHPMKPQSKLMYQWNVLWRRQFLTRSDIDAEELDVGKLRSAWDSFCRIDLPALRRVVGDERWIYSTPTVLGDGLS